MVHTFLMNAFMLHCWFCPFEKLMTVANVGYNNGKITLKTSYFQKLQVNFQ